VVDKTVFGGIQGRASHNMAEANSSVLIRCTTLRSSYICAICMQGGDSVIPPSTTMADERGVEKASSPPTEVCNAEPGGCGTEAPGSPLDQVHWKMEIMHKINI